MTPGNTAADATATSSTNRTGSSYLRHSTTSSRAGRLRGRYDRADELYDNIEGMYDSSRSFDEFDPDVAALAAAVAGRPAAAWGADSQGGGMAVTAETRRQGGVRADVASLLLWAVRMGLAPGPAGMQVGLGRGAGNW